MTKVANDIISCTVSIRNMEYLKQKDNKIVYCYILHGDHLEYKSDPIERQSKFLQLNRFYDTPKQFIAKAMALKVSTYNQRD